MADYVVALSAWLDPHLLLPLLDSCPASADLFQAQVKVVGATRLFDRMEQMSDAVFPTYEEKGNTTEEIKQLQNEVATGDRAAVRRLAKLLYETGDYAGALSTLKELSRLGEKDLWGLLHAAVAAKRNDEAGKYLNELRDGSVTSEQRLWLVHLSLFLAFPEHPSLLVETATNETKGLISVCPHLAKYLVAALLLTQDYEALTRLLSNIGDSSEPIVALVSKTVLSFDFKSAIADLADVVKIFKTDYFLKKVDEQLSVILQRFVVETYLRVHSRLSFQKLSEFVGLTVDEAELWAANLIRNARMEATISEHGIEILRSSHSLYSQIIEKTKEAYFRSKVLLSNVKAN